MRGLPHFKTNFKNCEKIGQNNKEKSSLIFSTQMYNSDCFEIFGAYGNPDQILHLKDLQQKKLFRYFWVNISK